MIDEGYTKYQVDWHRAPALPSALLQELNDCRHRLYQAGLIGYYEQHQVGYGNLSQRAPDGSGFIISGTGTGAIACTDQRHYSQVTGYDIDLNQLTCEGPVQASSEALTHAAIYALDPAIHAIVHAHSAQLWQRLLGHMPTTAADVAYGTPAMAREFRRLYQDTAFADSGVAVMAGHEEGIVVFGSNIGDATERLLALASMPA